MSFNFDNFDERLEEKAEGVLFCVRGYREVDLNGVKKGVFDLVVLGGEHDGKIFSQWFDQKTIFLAKRIFTACGIKSIRESDIDSIVSKKFICDVSMYLSAGGRQYPQLTKHRPFLDGHFVGEEV